MSHSIKGVRDFDLTHIFECGQCFRWERQADGSYTGIAKGHVANLRYEPDEGGDAEVGTGTLIIDPCDETDFDMVWRPYLDMDRDYGKIKETLAGQDEVMGAAISHGGGIRILQQDLWETILSFLISQNNHIPRIKGCIEALAQQFGQPVCEEWGKTWYTLPEPEVLAALTEADLAEVRLGYRAKYIIGAARVVAEKGLPADADQLLALPGVGPKVASCVRLFGMGDHGAFPIDVWMAKVMHQLYGLDSKDHSVMTAYAKEHFGDLGGFAQQYLFYYMRSLNG